MTAHLLRLYHEAGHALVGVHLGHGLIQVMVDPPSDTTGTAGIEMARADAAIFLPVDMSTRKAVVEVCARLHAAKVAVEQAIARGRLPADSDAGLGWRGSALEADEGKISTLAGGAVAQWGGSVADIDVEARVLASGLVGAYWPVIEKIVEDLQQRLVCFEETIMEAIHDVDDGIV